MSDLDRLMKQVEELKALAQRPDDTWMDKMSTEELQALGKRVRRIADGLSGMQTQLQRQVSQARGGASVRPPAARPSPQRMAGSGSLGSVVRRDIAPTTPSSAPPATSAPRANPFPGLSSDGDMSNPMQRRRTAPREAPAAPRPPQAWSKPGETPPPNRRGGRPKF